MQDEVMNIYIPLEMVDLVCHVYNELSFSGTQLIIDLVRVKSCMLYGGIGTP